MPPSREDFIRWRDDMVTQWVMKAHAQIAEDAKEQWLSASWGMGQANPLLLKELRVMADTYEAILSTGYEAYCNTLGEQPRDE